MAFVRARRRKTGTFFYVVEYEPGGKRIWRSAGRDRAFARRWASRINELKLRRKAGFPDEEAPERCLWTLGILRDRDQADARQRGLFMPSRESCWRNIVRVLDPGLPLTAVTPEAIRDATSEWLKTAKNRTANHYRAVLRFALRLARQTPESGYTGDPFAAIAALPERDVRASRALTEKQSGRLVRILRRLHPPTAVSAELLLLTASRHSEKGAAVAGALRYPGHKRGRPRAFRLDDRLRALLEQPRGWSRRAWRAATKKLGIPDLRPHDLRHTAATQAFLAGAKIPEVQELLGHQSPEMAQRLYTHLFPREMEPVKYLWEPGGKPGKASTPPRRRVSR